jgi:hypothetical protein
MCKFSVDCSVVKLCLVHKSTRLLAAAVLLYDLVQIQCNVCNGNVNCASYVMNLCVDHENE